MLVARPLRHDVSKGDHLEIRRRAGVKIDETDLNVFKVENSFEVVCDVHRLVFAVNAVTTANAASAGVILNDRDDLAAVTAAKRKT